MSSTMNAKINLDAHLERSAQYKSMLSIMESETAALTAAAGGESSLILAAATAIGKAKKPKAAKAAKAEKGPKRPASPGTKAWMAFILHAEQQQPSRFAGLTKRCEKLSVAKDIKTEDEAAYNEFVAEWKSKYPSLPASAAESDAEGASSAPACASSGGASASSASAAASAAPAAPKVKKPAALGTLAWGAYVKECKTKMPHLFAATTKESERLIICKDLRANDPEGYQAFTHAWKAERGAVVSI